MTRSMRQPTLETLGFSSVLDIFSQGKLPVDAAEMVAYGLTDSVLEHPPKSLGPKKD